MVGELAVQCQINKSVGCVATIPRYSSCDPSGKLDVKGKPANIMWKREELKVGAITSKCYSTTDDKVHTNHQRFSPKPLCYLRESRH